MKDNENALLRSGFGGPALLSPLRTPLQECSLVGVAAEEKSIRKFLLGDLVQKQPPRSRPKHGRGMGPISRQPALIICPVPCFLEVSNVPRNVFL